MIIDRQEITDDGTHLCVRLKDPFWSAAKKYGWAPGVEGFGINLKVLRKAKDMGRNVKVTDNYGIYTITPDKALKLLATYSSHFITRGVTLAVLPRDQFNKVDTKKVAEELEKRELVRAKVITKKTWVQDGLFDES